MSRPTLADAAVEGQQPVREQLLFIDDVAEWTGIPVQTLRWWRQHGKGPKSAKVGARVRYREADVQAWLDAQFEGDSNDADPRAS